MNYFKKTLITMALTILCIGCTANTTFAYNPDANPASISSEASTEANTGLSDEALADLKRSEETSEIENQNIKANAEFADQVAVKAGVIALVSTTTVPLAIVGLAIVAVFAGKKISSNHQKKLENAEEKEAEDSSKKAKA